MTFKKPEVSKYDVINHNSPLTVALHLAGPSRITKSYFKFDPKKHSIELMFTLLVKTHNKQKASAVAFVTICRYHTLLCLHFQKNYFNKLTRSCTYGGSSHFLVFHCKPIPQFLLHSLYSLQLPQFPLIGGEGLVPSGTQRAWIHH